MLRSVDRMEAYFDFEKPIQTLEKKLQDLRELSEQESVDLSHEIEILEKKVNELIDKTYQNLSTWQRVQLSRHPNRPYTRDYIEALFPDFMELSGDRHFSDDKAIIAGTATYPGTQQSFFIVGHQKGRTTKQKMMRNFGMAKPEGYRKAMRCFELANRSKMPILTFIDTPGAYPGIEAEERGQSQAIAESIRLMFQVKVPIVSVVIGEGGSGGALAIGIGNQVLMQEYSTYSVISPESCASILWSDSTLAEKASEKLKMYPKELKRLGVIDQIIPEPKGGAHRNWEEAFQLMQKTLNRFFKPLFMEEEAKPKTRNGHGKNHDESNFRNQRITKFRSMGSAAIGIRSESPKK